MPKMTSGDKPNAKAHDSAADEYGEGERAPHPTAYATLKHTHEQRELARAIARAQ